jgi:hypothetical protein
MLALSHFSYFLHETLLLSMMEGIKKFNDVNPDTVQLHNITSA